MEQVCTVVGRTWYFSPIRECKAPEPVVSVPKVLSPFWPPSSETMPATLLVLVGVVLFVVNALRFNKSDADKQYEERRMRMVMDQLAQVEVEHKENTAARQKWFERKAKLESHAKSEAAKSGEQWETIYRNAAAASGFADEELTTALPPERLLDAVTDKINDSPLDELPGLSAKLGTERLALFQELFDSCHAKLLERQVAVLDETVNKTREARSAPLGTADLAYTTGQELTEKIEQADKLKKLFYSRRFWVLPPRRRQAEPAAYLASLAAAKALHREVRRSQTSRFVRLLSYMSPATLGYVALMASCKVVYAAVGPLEAVYSSALGKHRKGSHSARLLTHTVPGYPHTHSARLPTHTVPGRPHTQCQATHTHSARSPTHTVPGYPHTQCQATHNVSGRPHSTRPPAQCQAPVQLPAHYRPPLTARPCALGRVRSAVCAPQVTTPFRKTGRRW